MLVHLATYNVLVIVLVWKVLAVPMILGADFGVRFVRATRPGCKDIELEVGTMISIVRLGSELVASQKPGAT